MKKYIYLFIIISVCIYKACMHIWAQGIIADNPYAATIFVMPLCIIIIGFVFNSKHTWLLALGYGILEFILACGPIFAVGYGISKSYSVYGNVNIYYVINVVVKILFPIIINMLLWGYIAYILFVTSKNKGSNTLIGENLKLIK